ncbi:fungal hydrophobin [Fistulina hepatica ATCC 64428]|nr:fungal hydrophobin [Fistulina hepatica ATCC 64428]
MQLKLIRVLSVLPIFITFCTAAPAPRSGSCNTGTIQCCNQVQSADDLGLSGLMWLLGMGIDVPVGLNCDPIPVSGIGSLACTAQTVCCENNSFSGLIAVGCSPINVPL